MQLGDGSESHRRRARLLMRRYELIGGSPDCELLPGVTDPREYGSRDYSDDEEHGDELHYREPAPPEARPGLDHVGLGPADGTLLYLHLMTFMSVIYVILMAVRRDARPPSISMGKVDHHL